MSRLLTAEAIYEIRDSVAGFFFQYCAVSDAQDALTLKAVADWLDGPKQACAHAYRRRYCQWCMVAAIDTLRKGELPDVVFPSPEAQPGQASGTPGTEAGTPKSTTRENIYSYIRQFLGERGYAPTVRDILKGCGISSTAVVQHHLNVLQREGRIHRDAGVFRSIRLTDHWTECPGMTAICEGDDAPCRRKGCSMGHWKEPERLMTHYSGDDCPGGHQDHQCYYCFHEGTDVNRIAIPYDGHDAYCCDDGDACDERIKAAA